MSRYFCVILFLLLLSSCQKDSKFFDQHQDLLSLKKSCESGNVYDCYDLGDKIHKAGAQEISRKYLSRACEGAIGRACYVIAEMDSYEVEKLKYHGYGCSLGVAESCLWSSQYYKNKNENLFLKFNFLECFHSRKPNCFPPGSLKDDPSISVEKKEIEKKLINDCQNGHKGSCVNYSKLYSEHGKGEYSFYFSKRACDYKYADGCYELSQFLKRQGNLNRAHDYARLACEYGQTDACEIKK